ncbi:MAG: acetate--CoA ligase family protein, partial [Nocardioidaceae bacterium]
MTTAAPPVPGSLHRVLHPRTVAVVGASGRPDSLGAQAVENLLRFGFGGDIHLVNPRHRELAGQPCYRSLSEVPGEVDLVLVLTPAATTHEVVAEAVAVGAGGAVVFSSGFAELSESGRREQERLVRTARRGGLRLLGPNCQGFLHQDSRLVATFSAAVRPGVHASSGISYVGQSGAVGGSFLDLARERGVGLASWFSTGNESDITATEIAADVVEQDDVRAIAMYLEAIPAGRDWQRLLERAQQLGKQVVVLRSGRSPAGRAAATSHTGAMIGPDTAFRLTCERYGAYEVENLSALLDAAVALAPGRTMAGAAVGVVTSSGGAGGLAADQLDDAGLVLADLQPRTRAEIAGLIPPYGSTSNPVDVTAQLFTQEGADFASVMRLTLDDDTVDAALVALTQVVDARAVGIARALADAVAGTVKPVCVVWLAATEQTREARRILRDGGVPVFGDLADAARALALLHRRSTPAAGEPASRSLDADAVRVIDRVLDDAASPDVARSDAARSGAAALTEWQGGPVLDALGIARPRGGLAADAEEAAAVATRLAGPFAVKVQTPDLSHKTDAGGVRLGVPPEQVPQAYEDTVG